MQYIYVLNYAVPRRETIKVADSVDLTNPENVDKILRFHNNKETECAFLISDKELEDYEDSGYITKV